MPPRPSSRMISYCPIRVPATGIAAPGSIGPVPMIVGAINSLPAVPLAGGRVGWPLSLDVPVCPGRMALHSPIRARGRGLHRLHHPKILRVLRGRNRAFAENFHVCHHILVVRLHPGGDSSSGLTTPHLAAEGYAWNP